MVAVKVSLDDTFSGKRRSISNREMSSRRCSASALEKLIRSDVEGLSLPWTRASMMQEATIR